MGVFIRQENALVCQYGGETVVIEPWGKNSLRTRAVMMGTILDTEFALLPQEYCEADITVCDDTARIKNGHIYAEATRDSWSGTIQISYYNRNDALLLREYGRRGALCLNPRAFKPIIGGDFSLTVSFESEPTEKLYGMGQYQQDIFNIKNCNFELAHRNSQASIPFVLSSLGYGFLWHNPAVGRASFGANRTEWVASSTKQLDYWITAGDTPAEIEQSYAKATGTVPMMPEYGMGFWQCKLRYWNQEMLLAVAREYKRRGIPLDVIVCDFFHWPKMGDYRFEEEFFPDPAAMVREVKELGAEMMVSVWPQIDHQSENFNEMRDKGLLVRPEAGVNIGMLFGGNSMFFDATNPAAREYVWQKCKKNYYDKGIRIFWLDEAEPEYGAYDFDNYRYHLGPNVQIGNLYPQMFSRTFYEGMTREGQRDIINLVRCAWAGSQRYGALVWSGDIHSDFDSFRNQITAGLHMGICGIAWWTTDIGGFMGGNPDDPAFRELLVRWFEYGTFCPVMRLHGDRDTATPEERDVYRADGSKALFTAGNNEVWSFGEEAYDILVQYIQLRELLRPYTRDIMRDAHERGTPVMRTLFYEFPQDARCWEEKHTYLFGPDILVAPVVQASAASREVYLPNGAKWQYAVTGQWYEGGQTVTVPTPLSVIPVFLRNGNQAEVFECWKKDYCQA